MRGNLLRSLQDARPATAEMLIGGRSSLVVVAPHPDDETLGCGATLSEASRIGLDCSVICVTDGSRSHPASRDWPAARLAEERRRELLAAVGRLAPGAEVHWLGHPDCAAPEGEDAARQIGALIPRDALVLGPWIQDPHIDHERTAQLLRLLGSERLDLRFLDYPIWGRFREDGEVPADIWTLLARDAEGVKRAALTLTAAA
ncbi:hypothetical protein GVY41_19300 [Frigidibacter albus]|uniref:PIG-L family deacetylase n=1 Tax=Frigidibacter albus TaxID=1465486 RepID=A0A6L8VPE0_9RHOB|nr:PIG-L family deacetylase [Frigidibacter albus]MZQ91219.1 hypothetical protein [Frigidibacter albus]NBE33146.1 hypothetical protein [Frigidibacter albus]GGH63502.1 hypothetical protein GCM10011341_38670 [Frigidibacter albus]